MPLERTEIIVLRRTQVRDTSVLLTCLSPVWGKLTLSGRAARRPGSINAEALQYFTVADVLFYQREKAGIDNISKAETREVFSGIVSNEKKYGFASAGLELVNLFLPEGEANREVYYLLKKYLRQVDQAETVDLASQVLHFWLLLCILAGYAPQLEACSGCGAEITTDEVMISPELGGVICANCVTTDQFIQKMDRGTVRMVMTLAETDIDAMRKVAMTREQAGQLKDLLVALTEYHVGRRAQLKSFDFLRKLNLASTDGG